jgi:hypothetical protein
MIKTAHKAQAQHNTPRKITLFRKQLRRSLLNPDMKIQKSILFLVLEHMKLKAVLEIREFHLDPELLLENKRISQVQVLIRRIMVKHIRGRLCIR